MKVTVQKISINEVIEQLIRGTYKERDVSSISGCHYLLPSDKVRSKYPDAHPHYAIKELPF